LVRISRCAQSQQENRCDGIVYGIAVRHENPPFILLAAIFRAVFQVGGA